MIHLTDKTAIVTRTSSGITLSVAAAGALVALADLRGEPIEGGALTSDPIRDAGGEASFRSTHRLVVRHRCRDGFGHAAARDRATGITGSHPVVDGGCLVR